MTTARIGLALRLLGPVLEFVCIGLLMWGPASDRSLLGLELESLLYLGLALGLAMVAIGLGLSVPRPRRRRDAGGVDNPEG